MLKLFFYILTFISLASAQSNLCNEELEPFPTRSGGRVKPFYVLAVETFKFISGPGKIDGLTPTEAFCKLSLKAFGMPLELNVLVKVEHIEVKKLLALDEREGFIPIGQLEGKKELIKFEMSKLKENNSYKKELRKVEQRLEAYEAITEGRLWTIPVMIDSKLDFIPIAEFLTEAKVAEEAKNTQLPVNSLIQRAQNDYLKAAGDSHLLELTYVKLNPFTWALWLSLLAMVWPVMFRKLHWPLWLLTAATIGLQLTAMVMRIMISGRAPVTNMYETVMFSGFGALLLSCLITYLRKEKAFLMAGLGYNILCLMMMKFANNMLDPGISPLVPVLRDNFWLSTHVTTVILSYAALALSWLIANGLLIRRCFFQISQADFNYGVDLIYSCIKYGVTLLAAGIILGGVWADYSWGRFWGWDPKETWSLIVLLVYMAILHGKYTSWIPARRFVPLVAGAFMSVMMAWFGVNYILASGLHSYGFSEGGAVFLGSFFLIQSLLLIFTALKKAPPHSGLTAH